MVLHDRIRIVSVQSMAQPLCGMTGLRRTGLTTEAIRRNVRAGNSLAPRRVSKTGMSELRCLIQ